MEGYLDFLVDFLLQCRLQGFAVAVCHVTRAAPPRDARCDARNRAGQIHPGPGTNDAIE
jgi:hypothetical protein